MKKLNTLLLATMLAFFGIQASYAQVPNTQLRAIDCGKINLSPVAQIACLPVASANLYQWEFRDMNTNAIVGTKNTNGTVFASSMVNFLQWNTQYNCAIRARVGFTFGSFGQSCVIGLMENPAITGVPPTSLRPQFCDASSLLLASSVSCWPVPMGTMYEFQFTNTVSQQITTVTQATTYLNLRNPTLALQIGQTYEVRTRGFVFNTWSNVTTVCIVSIELPLTNVVAGFIPNACMGSELQLTTMFNGGVGPLTFAWTGPNGYHSALQNPVLISPVSGTYTVSVTASFGTGSGSSSVSVTVNPSAVAPVIMGDFDFCPDNIATLDAGSGYASYLWSSGMQTQTTIALLPGVYSVIVSNAFGCTATASINILPCASNVTSTQLREVDCGQLAFTPSAEFAAIPVANATNYHWEFRNPATLALYATFNSNDEVAYGDATTPPLQFNTQYVARVKVMVAGEWSNYGALCTIGLAENPAITGVLPTQLRSEFCDSIIPIGSTIVCDPVSMGDIYEFEFTDLSNSSVTIAQGDLTQLVLDSVSPALITGHTYSVRVRAFVYNTWSNFGTACNITIGNSPGNAGSRESAPVAIAIDEANSILITNNVTEELLAYQNPFDTQSGFMVKSAENNAVTVYLFDALGHIIWRKQVFTNQYEQYNTKDLAPGLYFMSTSENNNNTVKIIKTNQ